MSTQNPTKAPENKLKGIVSPLDPDLDLVTVHGMNTGNNFNHAENTWTCTESGLNWLEGLLPTLLPRARVLAYQYNANIAFGDVATAGVKEQAENLLNCLWIERKIDNTRPIIFITHSMGGIIVKEALAIAYHESRIYGIIPTVTYGIVFFGVPHRGSELAEWGMIVPRIFEVNHSFITSVTPMNTYNRSLNERFKPLLEWYKYISVIETLPETKGAYDFGIIVKKDSAILGLPDDQELKIYLNRSHTAICKFTSLHDDAWKRISENLHRIATSAVQTHYYTPIPLERKKMFNTSFLQSVDEPIQAIDRGEAIARANEALKGIQQVRKELNETKEQIRTHQASLSLCANWVLTNIIPLLSVVLWFSWLSRFLPARDTIRDRAENALMDQQKIVEFEQESIQKLNTQLYDVLHTTSMLRKGSSVGVQPAPDDADAPPLQELNREAERLVAELCNRYRQYGVKQSRLKELEKGKKMLDELEDQTELLDYLRTTIEQEQTRYVEQQDTEDDEECSCIIQ